MEQKIDFTAVNDVTWNGEKVDNLKLDHIDIWQRYRPVIFTVRDSNTLGFIVTAGDTDVVVDCKYGQTIVPAGTTQNVSYATGSTDHSLRTQITFTGDVVEIGSMSASTSAKGLPEGYGNIAKVDDWGSLKRIGEYLFSSVLLDNATGLVIPNQITYIGDSAFFRSGIRAPEVVLPSYYTEFGDNVFYQCDPELGDKKDFVIPDWMTHIPYGFLRQTMYIQKVIIPDSVVGWAPNAVGVKGYAFAQSGTLREVVFNTTKLEELAPYTFSGAWLAEQKTLPEGLKIIGTLCFEDCDFTSLLLPSTLERIDNGAFDGCTALTTITIPANVTKIYNNAFVGCTALTSIVFENPNGWVDASGNAINLSDPSANVAKLQQTSNLGYLTRS